MTAPIEAAPEGKSPFIVNCGECRHSWTAAWVPMEVRKFVRLTKGLRCPACTTGGNRIFWGPAPAKTGSAPDAG